ncbi:hypothetical protein NDU88_007117 [Pleurodeles waltl]|uniref:WGR domain-containing protein n=1 Tax=Pleurodeles waltl TaxID=8319 RepID=A0AAV7VNU0_PLEWA|nr:hypothetical protein NDU88_007117 [Pleurodeles waltl]
MAWRRWWKKPLREDPVYNLSPRPILSYSRPPTQMSVWLKVRGGSGTVWETIGPGGARGAKPEPRAAEFSAEFKKAAAEDYLAYD